jgi:hypothetical protein
MSAAREPLRICDESEMGFGWISGPRDWMERASHALVMDGGVWLVDPVDFAGLDERVRAFGEPRAVLQLFGRHGRDCARIAARLGAAHLVTPAEVPGSPFELFRVPGGPGWHESALWWGARRTLVVGEAVGTARYYRAPGRPLGVHPLLRFLRRPAALLGREPEHILVGHGAGLHEDVPAALSEAVRHARRDLPRVVPRLLTTGRHRSRAAVTF